ncbi:hypothetical protein ACFL6L_02180 [candidate division KSB1 bacterium]
MDCPFCKEIIKEGAIVCRFCGRDLALYKPIFDRFEKIEKEMDKIVNYFRSPQTQFNEPAVSSDYLTPKFFLITGILVCLPVLGYQYYLSYQQLWNYTYVNLAVLAILGLWLGYSFRLRNSVSYILIGYMSMIIISWGQSGLLLIERSFSPSFFDIFVKFGIPGSLICWSGALIGRWANYRYRQEKKPLLELFDQKEITESSNQTKHFVFQLLDKLLPLLLGGGLSYLLKDSSLMDMAL